MNIGTIRIGTEPLAPPTTTSEVTRAYMSATPNLASKLKGTYSPVIGAGVESNYSVQMADAYSSIRKSFSSREDNLQNYSNPDIRVKPIDTSYGSIRN